VTFNTILFFFLHSLTHAHHILTLSENVLQALDVDRMVMGHTIQKRGINAALNGRLWRIDVGMSRGCSPNSLPEVLEITLNERNEEEVRVLSLEQQQRPSDSLKDDILFTAVSLPATERYVEYQVQNILGL